MLHNAAIRRLLAPWNRTLLHPQWFVFKNQRRSFKKIGLLVQGRVLDIGAGTREIEKYISQENQYISLDYYETAVEWYHSRPHIFGDGQSLPVKTASFDTVLILDVLEHLPHPEKAISEIRRILTPGGRVILQVPFLYPLHDEPYDFHRWTMKGLRQLAIGNGFIIEGEQSSGHPMETAALLSNLALSITFLNWFKRKNPMFLLAPVFLLAIPLINSIGWVFASLSSKKEGLMPHSYQCVWKKTP